jgi:hypothetical protein
MSHITTSIILFTLFAGVVATKTESVAHRASGRIMVAKFVPDPTAPPVITQGSGTR